MERLRRAGYALGGLTVVIGAVLVLRSPDKSPTEPEPLPPAPVQTTVKEYVDEVALVPKPGGKPEKPANLTVIPGPHRLQVTWTAKAPGYEVQLRAGDLIRTQLLAGNTIQFDGLDNNTEYQIGVRAVDSFGQQSEVSSARQRPSAIRPDESRYALVDHFDGQVVPDPARWRLANNAACARMSRGVGDDSRRLVISAACGNESVALRSRTPLQLRDIDGELGRVMIETDYPAKTGTLMFDLVPGPADLLDNNLPPGTLRVKVVSDSVTMPGADAVKIPPKPGLSTRWELVLRTDGLSLWRDGTKVAASGFVPTWTTATPLFGFVGPFNGLTYVGIDAIGLSSAQTPAFVAPPRITSTNTGRSPRTEPMTGVLGGQLRMTVRTTHREQMTPMSVTINGRLFPARPAVDGHEFEPSYRFPIVADIPADALVLSGDRRELRISVQGAKPAISPVVQHAELELIPDPASKPSPEQAEPPPQPAVRPPVTLTSFDTRFLDAAGEKIENNEVVSRGRIVLEVTGDEGAAQAGLAGIEVFIDNKRMAGIPTAVDGPAVAGRWLIALNSGAFEPGPHILEVKAVSTDPNVAPGFTNTTWSIPR
ncbi:fibronectin type III domain-containing protein [Kibdelosporangium philippinense]|uniref:Fibronectin type III domain-containing protein n=1 Tax=Kibdelosporangium philippinense TaxID=211113 RepID=A0ABS8ZNW4_9PSEU|nr:fibronectin type III domain-containing protein [Kibdelosporangium philippinense]MCE7009454.1 fibronectin type III domain-containing protein [Kibdelosporangium philippinense]